MLKIATINIRSLCCKNQLESARKIENICNLNSNIIVITEVNSSLSDWFRLASGPLKYLLDSFLPVINENGRRGIIILISKSCQFKLTNSRNINENATIFEVDNGTESISIAAVYGPSDKDDHEFFLNIKEEINNYPSKHSIIMGDFNSSADFDLDTIGYHTDPHWKTRAVMKSWSEDDLIDIWRYHNQESKDYTYETKSRERMARLDYIYISSSLLSYSISSDIKHFPFSVTDHSAVTCDFIFEKADTGPGIFRAMTTVHRIPAYQDLINHTIKETLIQNSNMDENDKLSALKQIRKSNALKKQTEEMKEHFKDATDSDIDLPYATSLSEEPSMEEILENGMETSFSGGFELLCNTVRHKTKTFQNNLKSEMNTTLNRLKNELNSLKTGSSNNKELVTEKEKEVETLQDKMLNIELEKFESWNLLNDEKPSSAFLKLENRRKGYSSINKINCPNPIYLTPEQGGSEDPKINPKKVLLTDPKAVRQHMKYFMETIYKKQNGLTPEKEHILSFLGNNNDNDVIEELNKRKLSEEEKELLEGEITKSELKTQLFQHMKPNSAPGIDGFTVAWIRTFWSNLEDLCYKTVNECYDKNKLSCTLRVAIMKLLRKGDKDPLEAGNYRPISLLSAFYKIASGVITRRLEKVMEKVIGRQQKAYSRVKNIGSVLINLLNVIDDANKKKMACLILCIDFKKAFDSLSHTFISNSLELLNFGPSFIKWVMLFFRDRWTYILLQGFLSDKIVLQQGVPQGDVLSPYIFNICVEVLLMKITKTKLITGIKIAGIETKAEAYADDTTILIERSEQNLRNLVKIIQDFAKISGLHANLEKTSVTPAGTNFSVNEENQICRDLKLDWKDSFTLLGVKIDSKLKHLEKNYEEKLIKAQTIISNWRVRPLTIHGRITVAKTLILSQFTYIAAILDLPNEATTEKIQNTLNRFVTNPMKNEDEKERKWLSTNMLYTSKAKGGLSFVNFRDFVESIKCSWIKRYTSGCNDLWCDLLDKKLSLHPGNRPELLDWGDREFDHIIEENLICLSSIFKSLTNLIRSFTTEPEAMDNRWLEQPVFRNTNITAKINNRRRAGFTTKLVEQEYYNLPRTLRLKICDLYERGSFKSRESLENTIRLKIQNEAFILPENSHLILKQHFSEIIGGQRRAGAPARRYDNVIPAKNQNLPEYTIENLNQLFSRTKKGSKIFRSIFNKSNDIEVAARIKSWQKTLSEDDINEETIRNAFKTVSWTALGNDICDSRLRLITRKTLFNNQIERAHEKLADKPIWTKTRHCERCQAAGQLETEDLLHAMNTCQTLNINLTRVLTELNLLMPNQHLNHTQSILWVSTPGQNPDNHTSAHLNNYTMMLFQHLILKSRYKNEPLTMEQFIAEIKNRFTTLRKTRPNHLLCKEIYRLNLEHHFFHNRRPPEQSSSQ